MKKERLEYFKKNGCGIVFCRDSKVHCNRIVIGKCGTWVGLCPDCEDGEKNE